MTVRNWSWLLLCVLAKAKTSIFCPSSTSEAVTRFNVYCTTAEPCQDVEIYCPASSYTDMLWLDCYGANSCKNVSVYSGVSTRARCRGRTAACKSVSVYCGEIANESDVANGSYRDPISCKFIHFNARVTENTFFGCYGNVGQCTSVAMADLSYSDSTLLCQTNGTPCTMECLTSSSCINNAIDCETSDPNLCQCSPISNCDGVSGFVSQSITSSSAPVSTTEETFTSSSSPETSTSTTFTQVSTLDTTSESPSSSVPVSTTEEDFTSSSPPETSTSTTSTQVSALDTTSESPSSSAPVSTTEEAFTSSSSAPVSTTEEDFTSSSPPETSTSTTSTQVSTLDTTSESLSSSSSSSAPVSTTEEAFTSSSSAPVSTTEEDFTSSSPPETSTSTTSTQASTLDTTSESLVTTTTAIDNSLPATTTDVSTSSTNPATTTSTESITSTSSTGVLPITTDSVIVTSLVPDDGFNIDTTKSSGIVIWKIVIIVVLSIVAAALATFAAGFALHQWKKQKAQPKNVQLDDEESQWGIYAPPGKFSSTVIDALPIMTSVNVSAVAGEASHQRNNSAQIESLLSQSEVVDMTLAEGN